MSSGIALFVAAIVGVGSCEDDDVVHFVQTTSQVKLRREQDDQVAPQLSTFRHFDADGSGGLNPQELETFLSERGVSRPRWGTADLNGNGELEYDELLDCVANPAACYPVPNWVSLVKSGPQSPSIDVVNAQHKAQLRMEALESFGLEEEEAINAARSNATVLRLHLMPHQGLQSPVGAACLDGSDAGFYFAPASSPEAKNKWIITLMGGAWCSTEAECADRAGTRLGSSRFFPHAIYMGGLLSDNCTVNPIFCDFNRVHVAYCDGSSFTGDRHDPVQVPGSNPPQWLYFRGKRILDATLDVLLGSFGLSQAQQVLLAGVSAGGVAALAQADRVHKRLGVAVPSLDKVRVVPLSGFFLRERNVEGFPVFPAFMNRMVALANSTSALNQRCVAAAPHGERWKCIFAEYSYQWTITPTFIVNSALDWWASECVNYPAQVPSRVAIAEDGSCGMSHAGLHHECANNVERCSPFEMFAMNQFIRDFVSALEANPSFGSKGNGAFVHSCHLHAEGVESKYWSGIKVRGISMQQAVLRWWKADGLPSDLHTYRPCTYSQGGANGTEWPYQCNPTCRQTM